ITCHGAPRLKWSRPAPREVQSIIFEQINQQALSRYLQIPEELNHRLTAPQLDLTGAKMLTCNLNSQAGPISGNVLMIGEHNKRSDVVQKKFLGEAFAYNLKLSVVTAAAVHYITNGESLRKLHAMKSNDLSSNMKNRRNRQRHIHPVNTQCLSPN
ncbi:hypothetical protein CRM22_009076, partial [Opisthorchis felineus]